MWTALLSATNGVVRSSNASTAPRRVPCAGSTGSTVPSPPSRLAGSTHMAGSPLSRTTPNSAPVVGGDAAGYDENDTRQPDWSADVHGGTAPMPSRGADVPSSIADTTSLRAAGFGP